MSEPRVTVKEKSFSLAVIGDTSSDFASVGAYTWGPVLDPQKINLGSNEFTYRYGKANDANYIHHLIVKDHMRKNRSVWVNRVAGNTALNANSKGVEMRINNEDEYNNKLDSGALNEIQIVGRYPGSLVNGMVIDLVTTDTIDTYEFRDSFPEKLQAGAFHVAVIDKKGSITKNPARNQQEIISVSVFKPTYYRSVVQEERLAIVCDVPSWTLLEHQEERLTVSGVVTEESTISIYGVDVALTNGMNDVSVINKIKNALVNSKKFIRVVSDTTNRTIDVTHIESGPIKKQINLSTIGITVNVDVIRAGYNEISFQYMGHNVVYRYDVYSPIVNHAANIALELRSVLTNNTDLKVSNTSNLGHTITLSRSLPGPISKLDGLSTLGVSINSTITTVGEFLSNVTFDGVNIPVSLNSVDMGKSAAQSIYQALSVNPKYSEVTINNNIITVTYSNEGYKNPLHSVSESGITISCSIAIPGFSGEIIEKYQNMRSIEGTKKSDGSDAYFINVINSNSNYIWIGEDVDTSCSTSFTLMGGIDDYNTTLVQGIEGFKSKRDYPIRGIFVHSDNILDTKYAIELAKTRADCVAYISLPSSVVFSSRSERALKATEWRRFTLAENNSYFFLDTGWVKFYDVDNDSVKWIPTCGGTSSLVAKLFATDEWHQSPGNVERGSYAPYVKLAWSPNEEEQAMIYAEQINSVILDDSTVMLFGDKTGSTLSNAFNRINVRNTFIVLEQDISKFARYFLFELHDDNAYTKIANAVVPYLEKRVSTGKISRALWKSDATINTAQDIVEHKLIGACLITPKYSINEVELIFGDVRPDIEFTEIDIRS